MSVRGRYASGIIIISAWAIDRPLRVQVSLDSAALQSLAQARLLPEVLQGLVQVHARRAHSDAGSTVAHRLVAVPESERPAYRRALASLADSRFICAC